MTTTCRLCKAPGGFTFRSAGNKTKKLLGGDNLYITLCRNCHLRETKLAGENSYQGDPTTLEADVESEENEDTDKNNEP